MWGRNWQQQKKISKSGTGSTVLVKCNHCQNQQNHFWGRNRTRLAFILPRVGSLCLLVTKYMILSSYTCDRSPLARKKSHCTQAFLSTCPAYHWLSAKIRSFSLAWTERRRESTPSLAARPASGSDNHPHLTASFRSKQDLSRTLSFFPEISLALAQNIQRLPNQTNVWGPHSTAKKEDIFWYILSSKKRNH